MKKINKLISIILSIVMLTSITAELDLAAYADTSETYTDGYYSYIVIDSEAIITDCDTSISGDISIPPTLGGYPVTKIGENAFYKCTDLTSIIIPNSVRILYGEAFAGCKSLSSVVIGVGLTTEQAGFEDGTFAGAPVTELSFAYGTTKITSQIIREFGSSLVTVNIPDTVTYIGDLAFVGCSKIENITIPQSVTRIEYNAFSGLTNITIKGYSNSYAETYAKWTGIPFIALDGGNPVTPSVPTTSGGNSGTSDGTQQGSTATAQDSNKSDSTTSTSSTKKPKSTSIKKLTKGKKKITVQWKKVSGVKGYQIQVATDKKFKKNKKTVTIKKNSTTKTTVKKLKSKKKYYVRVRTYKTVNGKKIYSSWSKVKTVKTN